MTTKTEIPATEARHGTELLRLARALRLSPCPLCAEPRKPVTDEAGRPCLLCPRCGDLVHTPVNLATPSAATGERR